LGWRDWGDLGIDVAGARNGYGPAW
jgi:hypothetical protein